MSSGPRYRGRISREELARAEAERLAEWRQHEELRELESRAAHRYTGVGVFLTAEELSEVRRLMLAEGDPRVGPGAAYRYVDERAREKGLPELPGHWGVHLETGELLEV